MDLTTRFLSGDPQAAREPSGPSAESGVVDYSVEAVSVHGSAAPKRTARALLPLIRWHISKLVSCRSLRIVTELESLAQQFVEVQLRDRYIRQARASYPSHALYCEVGRSLPRPVISRLTDFRWPAAPSIKQMSASGAPNQNRQNRLPKHAHI